MTQPRIGVDVGGTFTDVALITDEADLVTAKVTTTTDQSVGVVEGIFKACEKADINPNEIREFAHAMTVSVNTLLERSGAKTALVTTEGFQDILEIGRQDRPDLYDLNAEKPTLVIPRRRRFEVTERTTPKGVQTPIDPPEIRDVAAELQSKDIGTV